MPNRFLERIHRYIREGRYMSRGASANGEHRRWMSKEYPRMPKIQLSCTDIDTSLQAALQSRTSSTEMTESAISVATIGTLLGHSLRARRDRHRPYPSGGSIYPIETYLIGTLNDHLPAVYHYEPHAHVLEHLWDLPADFSMSNIFINEYFAAKPLAFIFTSIWGKMSGKYGDFAYNLALIEAGHMAQNIALVAGALSLPLCPVGGFRDQQVAELLDLDENLEQSVYAIALG